MLILKKLFPYYRRFFSLLATLLLLLLLAIALPAQAQLPGTDTSEQPQEVAAPAWPDDSLGRRTPRGTVSGFIKAVAAEDYERAAQFIRIDPILQKNQKGPDLARALQRILDKAGNIMPYSFISNSTTGIEGDNLGPSLDRVGSATVNGETFDILLEQTEGAAGGPIWLFSSQTMQRLPVTVDEGTGPLINNLLPAYLKESRWGGVPVGHWMAIVVLLLAAYLITWGFTSLILFLIPFFWRRARTEPTAGVIKAFALPIRLYLSVWVFMAASQEVGISIVVRQQLSEITIIAGLLALLILLWRLTGFISGYSEKLMTRRNNMAGVSAVLFLSRVAKIAIVVFGAIGVLYTFGFDVTTGLAALGIGGLALALGAQKTVENFVGSVTLIADQPIRVGDFCKVGDTVGTVEQIGMRSTRIRTLDRTIVTIPNGDFSSQRIENFAHRDRFRLHTTFGLRFETTPEQIRYLLVELRTILYAHPKVDPDPARIRFVEIGADSLNLEIFAYVHAADFSAFLEVKEDLYLRMMDVIEASGTGFAFPSQTLYLARDKGVDSEKTKEAAERVQKWRDAGELRVPNFEYDHIQNLRNTITYPPEGTMQQAKPE